MTLFHKPLLLHYYVTTACNCRCSFCNIPMQKGSTAKIEEIKSNLAHAKRLGVRFVDFTGGEPLLFNDLPEALREAKKNKLITSVTTNGVLLKKRASDIAGLIDLPRISLDGSENIHNDIRGVDCYGAAVEGLGEAVKNGIKFDIIFTLTEKNRDEIEHVYQVARKHNAILILDPAFSYFGNDNYIELDEILHKWRWRRGVYVNTAFLSLRKSGGNRVDNPVCKTGKGVIVVSPDNNLLLPCFHAQQSKVPINGNLTEVWNSKLVKAERKLAGTYGACDGCAINCYMDPSFCYQLNGLFVRSLLAKGKYVLDKKFTSAHIS
ncbi:MAG: radical SAM protein [Fibrobacteres bacterium]|nr:radical SAM protein [Fibrobacterota bacterium]